MKRFLTCIFTVIFLCGCATTPITLPIKNSNLFKAEYDKIWTATMQVLVELKYPLRVVDKSSGVITTDYVNLSGKETLSYAQYNKPFSDRFGRFNLNIIIQKDGSDNIIRVISNIEVSGTAGGPKPYWVNRPSNGQLESMIFNKIRSKILEFR